MKYGFVVEGHLESEAVNQICPGSEVRRLGLNGRDVSIDRMVAIIYPHVVFLMRKVDRIFIIVDREQRSVSAIFMEDGVRNKLREKGLDVSRIFVSVPDRNIESWFAPFLDDSCVLQRNACSRTADGRNAKGDVKIKFRRNGRKYVGVIDGVKYVKLMLPGEVAKISRSFSRFFENLTEDCWWKARSSMQGIAE